MALRRTSPPLQYVLITLVGLGFALLAMMFTRRMGYSESLQQVDRRAEQLTVAVQRSFDAKLEVLHAFEALYAVDDIDAGTFTEFADTILRHHGDVQALQWIPYVPQGAREAFEAEAREIHGADFTIKERAPDGSFVPAAARDYYFPILYTVPVEGNETVIGLDAAFEPTRRAVVERAWLQGEITVSTPITLVQETSDQTGVLIYQPIYTTVPAPSTEAARRASVRGLVPVVLRVGDFMTDVLSEFDASGFSIALVDTDAERTTLFRMGRRDATRGMDGGYRASKPVTLAGRALELRFYSTTMQIERQTSFSGIIAFASILVIDAVVLIYVFQRNRSERDLRRYTATLETTNRELDAYNYTIAHDLKHPLAIINGYAYLLTDEQLTPDGRRMLDMIPTVVSNMVEMIDGLLQLAKLRDARAAVTAVDMETTLAKAIQRFDDARDRITVEGELPAAMGHAPWLVEVFANLLNNALKYTPAERVPDVRVRGRVEGRRARYEVQDNGVGIAPEDQQRIFEMFTRAQQQEQLTLHKGLGIGLSIVQRVIQRLGGEVGVTSTPGEGSTFWFTLPTPPEANLSGQGKDAAPSGS